MRDVEGFLLTAFPALLSSPRVARPPLSPSPSPARLSSHASPPIPSSIHYTSLSPAISSPPKPRVFTSEGAGEEERGFLKENTTPPFFLPLTPPLSLSLPLPLLYLNLDFSSLCSSVV